VLGIDWDVVGARPLTLRTQAVSEGIRPQAGKYSGYVHSGLNPNPDQSKQVEELLFQKRTIKAARHLIL